MADKPPVPKRAANVLIRQYGNATEISVDGLCGFPATPDEQTDAERDAEAFTMLRWAAVEIFAALRIMEATKRTGQRGADVIPQPTAGKPN